VRLFSPGVNVLIFKIFSPKHWEKEALFFLRKSAKIWHNRNSRKNEKSSSSSSFFMKKNK
jgi:hypothetical protein